MTFPTHLALGLVIGKLTGSYEGAVLGSVAIDADHLLTYARHGILNSPRLFLQTILKREDPFASQRGALHNLFALSVAIIVALLVQNHIFTAFVLGYAGHLLLDALDGSDFWPFFPFRKINVRGPIPYLSIAELIFGGLLIAAFFAL